MICFDFDLDPERRLQTPFFYGYVPNTSRRRNVVFVSMLLFSACHVAVRMLGVALLASVDPFIVVAMLGGDMLLYFVFKVLRGDLRYSLKLKGFLSWSSSVLLRLFVKIMVDFGALVHFRHPQELGEFQLYFKSFVCRTIQTPPHTF